MKQLELDNMKKEIENEEEELIDIHRLQSSIEMLNSDLEKAYRYIDEIKEENKELHERLEIGNKETDFQNIYTKMLFENIKLK